MTLNANILKSWAIKALKEQTVVVQIGIGYGTEVCRGQFTKIDLELAIPKALEAQLLEASARGSLLNQLSQPPPAPPEVITLVNNQLYRSNPETKQRSRINLGNVTVLAAAQDALGAWWLLTQRGCPDCGSDWVPKIMLYRIPVGFDPQQMKGLALGIPPESEHVDIHFGNGASLRLTHFSARSEAAQACGNWSDRSLCDEAMGWTERKTYIWDPGAIYFKEMGIPVPGPSNKATVNIEPVPSPYQNLACECWGERQECGQNVPFGRTGMQLMMVDVSCGDLAHPSCVLQSADRHAILTLPGDQAQTLKWMPLSSITDASRELGSCGPFFLSPKDKWFTNGNGMLCTIGQQLRCEPLQGDYLGMTVAPVDVELR